MISGVFKILLGLALVFAVFVFGVFWSRELEQISVLESSEEKIEDVIEVIEVREPLTNPLEPGKTISPPPLEVAKKEETVPIFSILTREGIVSWTNFFRILESLKAVDADLELDKIAQTKLNDMFARQYFEHVSPVGEGIGDVAQSAGYKFVLIGENLAMGDFKDDEDVVRAWMGSPGHRENILKAGYTRIGVAAKKDFLNGRLVWVAVQIFAIPLSACLAPEPELLLKIESNKNQVASLKSHLALLRDTIEKEKYETQEQYENMVAEHNSLAGVYNSLSKETKILIQEYNSQVEIFNKCVDSFDA